MSAEGFDDFFDAYAVALLREDGVAVGAFAEPAVIVGPAATVVCASHAELADWLAEQRADLQQRGFTELRWDSIEARRIGEHQHQVCVTWDHGAEALYVLRGEPPDALITAIVTA